MQSLEGNAPDAALVRSMLEDERARIARAIHDGLAQKLTALAFEIALLDGGLNDSVEAAQALRLKIENLRELVGDLIKSVRKIESELHPKVLDEFGLTAALEWQSRSFQRESGIQCTFTAAPEDIVLDLKCSTEIFRLFQEILSNVSRHSAASRVDVCLAKREGWLRLTVQHQGCVITEKQIAGTESAALPGVRERVALMGGQLHVKGIPGTGTTVTLEVPIKNQRAA